MKFAKIHEIMLYIYTYVMEKQFYTRHKNRIILDFVIPLEKAKWIKSYYFVVKRIEFFRKSYKDEGIENDWVNNIYK